MKSDKETMNERRIEKKRGQVMLEYLMTLVVFVLLFGMCGLLLGAFRVFGSRVLSLIASG